MGSGGGQGGLKRGTRKDIGLGLGFDPEVNPKP